MPTADPGRERARGTHGERKLASGQTRIPQIGKNAYSGLSQERVEVTRYRVTSTLTPAARDTAGRVSGTLPTPRAD